MLNKSINEYEDLSLYHIGALRDGLWGIFSKAKAQDNRFKVITFNVLSFEQEDKWGSVTLLM